MGWEAACMWRASRGGRDAYAPWAGRPVHMCSGMQARRHCRCGGGGGLDGGKRLPRLDGLIWGRLIHMGWETLTR